MYLSASIFKENFFFWNSLVRASYGFLSFSAFCSSPFSCFVTTNLVVSKDFYQFSSPTIGRTGLEAFSSDWPAAITVHWPWCTVPEQSSQNMPQLPECSERLVWLPASSAASISRSFFPPWSKQSVFKQRKKKINNFDNFFLKECCFPFLLPL